MNERTNKDTRENNNISSLTLTEEIIPHNIVLAASYCRPVHRRMR